MRVHVEITFSGDYEIDPETDDIGVALRDEQEYAEAKPVLFLARTKFLKAETKTTVSQELKIR